MRFSPILRRVVQYKMRWTPHGTAIFQSGCARDSVPGLRRSYVRRHGIVSSKAWANKDASRTELYSCLAYDAKATQLDRDEADSRYHPYSGAKRRLTLPDQHACLTHRRRLSQRHHQVIPRYAELVPTCVRQVCSILAGDCAQAYNYLPRSKFGNNMITNASHRTTFLDSTILMLGLQRLEHTQDDCARFCDLLVRK